MTYWNCIKLRSSENHPTKDYSEMIDYDKNLAGYDPANGEKPRHFHINNIIRLLDRIEEARHKAITGIFEPGGALGAWENLNGNSMQLEIEVAYGHALRLREWIQAAPDEKVENHATLL